MDARAVPTWLHAQIEYLRNNAPLPLKVENLRAGTRGGHVMDRFTVLIPCCLSNVKWEVVFNGLDAKVAPDIIFGVDDESFQPLANSSEFSPGSFLRDWTVTEPNSLLKLILVTRGSYLDYQRHRVEAVNDPRVKFEINTMSGLQGLEMCITTTSDRSEEVNFAVPLVLEVEAPHLPGSHLPSSTLWNDISLQVKFPLQRGQTSAGPPQLKLVAPPAMREVFDVDDVRLPVWPGNICLVEYIPSLQQTLQQQVREARASIALRRSFMEALFPFFGRPLEADATYCRRISLLASSGAFTFLVHLALPIQFPKVQPTLTFQSSQHFDTRGRPLVSRTYMDYPWSPRWDAPQMAQRIMDFVADECIAFKKQCNDLLHHQR
ncbi:hypothetical protein CY35_07G063000 [Sphagnum magellanicum]|uniref:Uncharacterized protein n=2 Tax=Sphagnum magellanicum TaxID=128215 RepID=A0ACB8HLD8_9BRYO|nr:hypothetical protein CY35_07G063000 [Sphagnum magellanicum]KAH9557006.1 hypothetical protein CY35_07G063000 [Sphagnum magellanicum]